MMLHAGKQFTPNASTVDMKYSACSWSKPCLFNMEKDASEHNDLAAERPNIVADLKQVLCHLPPVHRCVFNERRCVTACCGASSGIPPTA